MKQSGSTRRPGIADARESIRHVFIRDLELDANIGVHAHEKNGPQKVLISVDLSVIETLGPLDDHLANVVCYEAVIDRIRTIVGKGHINLVETLAELIAEACLDDRRVIATCVRVEKINAVPQAASVGVEIERRRSGC